MKDDAERAAELAKRIAEEIAKAKTEIAAAQEAKVAKYMRDAGWEADLVEKLYENDVSGAILPTLRFSDICELVQPFERRHQLWDETVKLQDPNNSTVL